MTNTTAPAPHSTEAIIAAQLATIEVHEANLAEVARIAETPAAKRTEGEHYAHQFANRRAMNAYVAIERANANLKALGYVAVDPFADFDEEVAA